MKRESLLLVASLMIAATPLVAIPVRLNFFDAARNVGRVTGTFVVQRNEFGVSFNPGANPIEAEVAVQFGVAFYKPAA